MGTWSQATCHRISKSWPQAADDPQLPIPVDATWLREVAARAVTFPRAGSESIVRRLHGHALVALELLQA